MKRFYSMMVIAIMALVSLTTSAQVKSVERSVVGATQVKGTLTRIGDAQKQTRTANFNRVKMQQETLKAQTAQAIRKAPAKAHEDDTWNALGTASYTDDVTSIYGVSPVTVEVEVEESNETPGLYRLVNPYAPVQAAIGGSYDSSSDHYMYIDATNPDQVFVEDFYTGLTLNSADGELILLNGAAYGLGYGTMEDGVIRFAAKTLACSFTNDTGLYYANSNGKFQVILPGVEVLDLSVSVEAPACADDNKIDFTVETGADVAAIKYMLIPGEYGFNAGNYQYVAENGYDIPEAGTFTFELADADAGRYTLFVATLDADGNYGDGEGTYFYSIQDDEENWNTLGNAVYTDDIVAPVFNGLENTEYEVEIQENVNTPGYYRLVNPYGEAFPYHEYDDHEAAHNHYLYINASDPEKVVIEDSPLGVDFGYGSFSAVSMTELDAQYQTADYYGTLVNGKITFPTKALLTAMQKNNHGGWLYANKNGKFSVQLPVDEDTIVPQDDQIDFKNGEFAMSSNTSHDGDITETTVFDSEKGLFTLTATPNPDEDGTVNRVWDYNGSAQLRYYNGELTIDAKEGYLIKNVTIAGASGNWNKDANFTIDGLTPTEVKAIEGNIANSGKLVYNCDTKQVKINVTAQVRIDVLTLTIQAIEPLYRENGVVGAGTLDKGMPFFNTPVKVAVYDNKVVIKGWDGVKGSDLNIYYAGMQVNEETMTRIIGIEQTVVNEDGVAEVVSEFVENEEDLESSYVSLNPQGGDYVAAIVYPFHEMTGIMLGEDDEAGMGQFSLYGTWMKATEAAEDDVDPGFGGEEQNTIEAAYIVTWPGEPMEIPAEMLYEIIGETESIGGEQWGESCVAGIRNIKVEGYDDNSLIIRGFMGVAGYDIKMTLDEEGTASSLTSIINGEVVATAKGNNLLTMATGNENIVKVELLPSYSFSDGDDVEGFVVLQGYFTDAEGNRVPNYYFLAWPQITIYTLAELKATEIGEDDPGMLVKVNLENANITLFNAESGLGFMQDAEVGIVIATDPDEPVAGVEAGKALNGIVYGSWMNLGMSPVFVIMSLMEAESVDGKVTPAEIASLDDLADNDCRLVTITNTEATPITVADETIYVGEEIMVGDINDDEIIVPEGVQSVTGVYAFGAMLYIRDLNDIVDATGTPVRIENIVRNMTNDTIFNLAGQAVKNAQRGLYIINGKKQILK